jgi:hypothetical protein
MESLDALADIRRQTFEATALQRWEKGLPVNAPEGEDQVSEDEE